MTLGEAITMVLNRVGLDTTNADFKNEARNYINLTAAEIAALVDWWWLDRTTSFVTTDTLTVSGGSGTFVAGETITGGTSSKTATVDGYRASPKEIYVYSPSGTFTATETLTGGTSGATAAFGSSAGTRVYKPISSAVGSWYSFYDQTNENPLAIIGPDQYDLLSGDYSDTGTVESVFVGGVDTTTGYPIIELWRVPDTTNETIRVRYRIAMTSWVSGNDTSSFLTLGLPQVLEGALVYGATKLYLMEKGDHDGAMRESSELARTVDLALRQNLHQQGNRTYPAAAPTTAPPFQIVVDSTLVTTS